LKFLQQAQIQVNTNLDELAHVLEWFDQFNSCAIPRPIWLQCQLALAEGFTNAVRHAHRGKPLETPVEIEVTVLSQSLEIRIWDSGSVFDLKHVLETLPVEMDKEAEGGRGLKLIKRMADRVDYVRTTDDRNCLLIVKDYPRA
jgi:serine/threonine-protein kinase RsbW